MQILVCDDEPLARARLVRWLEELEQVDEVHEAANGAEAFAACQSGSMDLVFMDIRMPKMDGLEAAAAIKKAQLSTLVVFCTAYDEHALEAFRVQAMDYLLKPVSREAVLDTLQRVAPNGKSKSQHISARTHRGMEVVPIDEVRCFLAEHKYVTAYFPAGELLLDESLVELEQRFPEVLVRVHRSALVAKSHIEGLDVGRAGAWLRLRGVEKTVPVSRRLLPHVRRLLTQL